MRRIQTLNFEDVELAISRFDRCLEPYRDDPKKICIIRLSSLTCRDDRGDLNYLVKDDPRHI